MRSVSMPSSAGDALRARYVSRAWNAGSGATPTNMVPCSFAVHAHIYTKKTEIVIAPIGSACVASTGEARRWRSRVDGVERLSRGG